MGNPYAPKKKATAKEAPAPEVVEEETPSPDEVPEGTAAEVLEWVGDDSDRAKKALEAEEQGENRIGLSKKLRELI